MGFDVRSAVWSVFLGGGRNHGCAQISASQEPVGQERSVGGASVNGPTGVPAWAGMGLTHAPGVPVPAEAGTPVGPDTSHYLSHD